MGKEKEKLNITSDTDLGVCAECGETLSDTNESTICKECFEKKIETM